MQLAIPVSQAYAVLTVQSNRESLRKNTRTPEVLNGYSGHRAVRYQPDFNLFPSMD